MIPETPSSATIGKSTRARPTRGRSSPGSPKMRDHQRREQDEERREPAEAEQHQPEQARGDAPGALALALLEQVAEDRHERGRERGVGDERADLFGTRNAIVNALIWPATPK